MGMGKETRIGLVVVSVLLFVFGSALVYRLWAADDVTQSRSQAASEALADPDQSSGPNRAAAGTPGTVDAKAGVKTGTQPAAASAAGSAKISVVEPSTKTDATPSPYGAPRATIRRNDVGSPTAKSDTRYGNQPTPAAASEPTSTSSATGNRLELAPAAGSAPKPLAKSGNAPSEVMMVDDPFAKPATTKFAPAAATAASASATPVPRALRNVAPHDGAAATNVRDAGPQPFTRSPAPAPAASTVRLQSTGTAQTNAPATQPADAFSHPGLNAPSRAANSTTPADRYGRSSAPAWQQEMPAAAAGVDANGYATRQPSGYTRQLNDFSTAADTDPRGADPRGADPRTADLRTIDTRGAEARGRYPAPAANNNSAAPLNARNDGLTDVQLPTPGPAPARPGLRTQQPTPAAADASQDAPAFDSAVRYSDPRRSTQQPYAAAGGTVDVGTNAPGPAPATSAASPYGRRATGAQAQPDYPNASEAPRYNNSGASSPYRDSRAATVDPPLGAGNAAQYESQQDDSRTVDHPYKVVYGDSYWLISQRLYNTGEYHQALEAHNRNRIATASQLKPGRVISAPAAADLERMYPKLVPQRGTANVVTARDGSRLYVVQEGDTLYDIARFQLGRAARWVEVYDLNRDQLGDSFDSLAPGMRLRLPEATPPRGPVTNTSRTPLR